MAEAKSKNLTVNLKDIILPDDWNREKLGDIKGLVQSIKEKGQKVAITVRSHPDKKDKVILIDGRRRYAALSEAGVKEAIISFSEEENDLDAFETSMIANLARENNNPWEISCGFHKLKEGGKTVKAMAKACGKSEGYVSQHLAAQSIHKKLQNALKTGKIPLSMVRAFARLDYQEENEKVFYDKMVEYALGGMSAQDIWDKVDIFVEKKAKSAPKSTGGGKGDAKGKGKGKAAAKKGGAAKKKPGPKVKVTDYADPEVRKLVKMVPKDKGLEWLEYYGEKLQNTSSTRKREYYQGVIEGLEIACGLIVEE
jgi:ParB/RepB/Spo0J family partition protein